MRLAQLILHLLFPRESNNHKAKLLHPSSLLVVACFILAFQSLISLLPGWGPNVLGFAAQIPPSEVVRLTNEKRAASGLAPLTLNQTLSSAAYTKGRDMIDRDYWAHIAPDGTQPWKFFNDFGYRYKYAGENLARDFSSANAAVEAWMGSPTHRENILNPKYKEIGIGVVEGDLAGVDSTVIVQFFGATAADAVIQPIAKAEPDKESTAFGISTPTNDKPAVARPTEKPIIQEQTEPQAVALNAPVTESIQVLQANQKPNEVLISPFTTTRSVSIFVISLLLVVFVVDAIIVSRRRIARIAGRTMAHVAYLAMVLIIVFIIKSGSIL